MNPSDLRFPRSLEALYGADTVNLVLKNRTARLWTGGVAEVPLIALTEALRKALRLYALKGQIACGFETASERLKNEEVGLALTRGSRPSLSHSGRVSRLILLSNDGAERLYRHTEQLLKAYGSRLLVCMLEADSSVIGEIISGKEKPIKLIMAERKEAVTGVLRAIIEGGKNTGGRAK